MTLRMLSLISISEYMFMVIISVKCDLSLKTGDSNIFKLKVSGTQFLNTG